MNPSMPQSAKAKANYQVLPQEYGHDDKENIVVNTLRQEREEQRFLQQTQSFDNRQVDRPGSKFIQIEDNAKSQE